MSENRLYVTQNPDIAVETNDEDSAANFPAGPAETDDARGADEFMQLFEENLKSLQEGEVLSGRIVQVDKEWVFVDVGYKSEGRIHVREFTDMAGKLTAEVGDTVDVLLERKEDDDETLILSKEKAAAMHIREYIRDVYENGGRIKGNITARVKGGLSVDIGLPAFLPGSQIGLRPVKDKDALVGTAHSFKILDYDHRRGNLIVSRRAVLEEEYRALKEHTLKSLKEGAVLAGTVKNIKDYGVFVDLGGIVGLAHISDISWGRIGHPSERYRLGDQIKVKVLSIDRDKERVSLGIKQLVPDPWSDIRERYAVGARVKGRVVSLKDYGAFVAAEEGIEGLLHVSKISWTRKVIHPSQVLSVGDVVEVIVLNLDADKRRISFGYEGGGNRPLE